MESVNFIKGYDKVIPSEEDPNGPPINRRFANGRKVIAFSAAIVLAFVTVSLIAAFVFGSITGSRKSDESITLVSNSDEAIKAACSVTLHPDSCFSSISPLNMPPINTPLRFLNLSLQASINQVSILAALPGNSSNDSASAAALKDCADLFSEAASQLEKSAGRLRVSPGEKVLTQMRISDIQTWMSAAMTDLETCLDSIEDMGSTGLEDVKAKVHRSQEFMSNTLAILNNIQSLYHKFSLRMP